MWGQVGRVLSSHLICPFALGLFSFPLFIRLSGEVISYAPIIICSVSTIFLVSGFKIISVAHHTHSWGALLLPLVFFVHGPKLLGGD